MNKAWFNPIQIQSNLTSTYGVYTEFKPAENLRKYIYCYWTSPLLDTTLFNELKVQRKEFVIPDGCIDVLFGTDKNGDSCQNILVGTMSKGITVNMEHENIQTFGIRFYPGGLQAFIKENTNEFTDKIKSIDDINQNVFTTLMKELSNIKDISNKLSFANKYLTQLLRDKIPGEDKFQSIIYQIYKTKGVVLVKDIAHHQVISEKQLGRIIYKLY